VNPTFKQNEITGKMPQAATWFLVAAIVIGMSLGASWYAAIAGIGMLIMVAVIYLADVEPIVTIDQLLSSTR
jgi:glucose dehydrogenase